MKKAKGEEQKFSNTPRGLAQRYTKEFTAAKKHREQWHNNAQDAVDRYLDKRETSKTVVKTRWNFYPANVQMKAAVLYGRPPKVSVTRRFHDAHDAVARVAGEMLERLLNTDLQRDTDDYAHSLRLCLFDRLVPGGGFARLRYVSDEEAVPGKPARMGPHPTTGEEVELAPEVPESTRKVSEDVETVYAHWQDVLWNAARTFGEVRWMAFRERMSRKALVERFGKIGELVPLGDQTDSKDGEQRKDDPWGRADVWEIWDKENERVAHFVEGFPEILDVEDDPYGLEGFWPVPTPMMANLSTSDYMPNPDFTLCKDIYREIDDVSERITLLEQAIRVVGCYDKNAKELRDVVNGARRNEMVPVPNWAAFAEKGGLKGVMDFVPLEMWVAALDKLRDYRQELISTVAQLDGTSDIVRGQQMENGTPGEAQLKAKFSGIRMQQLQEEFAQFASEIQQIRAELIAKFWDIETIIERSNAQFTMDAQNPQLLMQAAQLIKDKVGHYRIEIEPDALAQSDMAALKQERTEWLGALSGFLQAAAPMAQQIPSSLPFLLEILKWTMSAFKGSQAIGGILDQAIAAAQQQQAQGPQQGQQGPDPKMLTAQIKGQMDLQKIQAQSQAEMMHVQAETQALAQRRMTDATISVKEEQAKQHIKNGGFGGLPGGAI